MNEYLTFSLSGDRYAFAIEDVDSVVESADFTHLPQTAAYVRGIMNLRGAMIPVVDLRLRFDLPQRTEHSVESVIVLSLGTAGETSLVGAIADEVHEVIVLDQANIEPTPSIAMVDRFEQSYVSGIGKNESGFIVLLDVNVARAECEAAELNAK